MTTAELELENALRDQAVQSLRAEQLEIHGLLERRWLRAQAARRGDPALTQQIGGRKVNNNG
jgi:hypothetical protein